MDMVRRGSEWPGAVAVAVAVAVLLSWAGSTTAAVAEVFESLAEALSPLFVTLALPG